MPRRSRIRLPGFAWHLIQRGNNRFTCFFAEDDYSHFEPECELDRRPLTAGSIMDHTIRPILRRSHLVGLRLADGEAVEIDHLLHALS